jgi:hypothetical protein
MPEFRMILSIGLMLFLACFPSFADGKLLATDLYNEPNSVIAFTGEDGLINYIQATFNPGDGYMVRYGIEIADDPAGIHGIGIVKSDRITPTSPGSYRVKGYSTFPVDVSFGSDAVILGMGSEIYRVSKPRDYLVEVWPLGPDGKPDLTRRFAYMLTKNRSYGFLGIIDKSYIPDYSIPLKDDLDPDSIYYPQDFRFDGKTETALVHQIGGDGSSCFRYDYSFEFSKDPEINRQNFLILLTQRRGYVPEYPMIHAVLLTIYFYEAMMP